MDELWQGLAQEDPQAAFEAMWALIAAGEEAVSFLAGRLADVIIDPARIEALAAKLNDDDWRIREEATEALVAIGKAVEGPLEQMLAKIKDGRQLEVRARIEEILRRLKGKAIAPEDARRYARARHILRIVRSDAARDILKHLAVEAWQSPPKKKPKDEKPKPQPPGLFLRQRALQLRSRGPAPLCGCRPHAAT
jgi:HEAT repeat protein